MGRMYDGWCLFFGAENERSYQRRNSARFSSDFVLIGRFYVCAVGVMVVPTLIELVKYLSASGGASLNIVVKNGQEQNWTHFDGDVNACY